MSGAGAAPGGPPPFGVGVPGNRWDLLSGAEPERWPTVTVVVVHFRQQRELDRTLAALRAQTYPAELLDVVVVDDGSPEAPVVPHGVTLLRQHDDGFRAGAARNLGVASSRGEILCFLDADTSPEPDYVQRMARLPALAPEALTVGHRRHADFARLASVLPSPSPSPTSVAAGQDEVGRAAEVELAEPGWLVEAYRASGDLLEADQRSYRYVIGAVLCCTRWFFEQVGGFDETFRDYGGEDWEWAHRAWVAGAVLAHVPDAVAWHDGPDWDARTAADPARLRRKNAETLALAASVPVRGSRPHALLGGAADVVVRLAGPAHAGWSDAAMFVAVDSILTALPQARVEVTGPLPSALTADPRVEVVTRVPAAAAAAGDGVRSALSCVSSCGAPPRVVVEVARPIRVRAEGAARLAWAVEAVGVGTLGAVEFTGADGASVVAVRSNRAGERARRWGTDEFFETIREPAPWLAPLDAEPDVEAYLGGWS